MCKCISVQYVDSLFLNSICICLSQTSRPLPPPTPRTNGTNGTNATYKLHRPPPPLGPCNLHALQTKRVRCARATCVKWLRPTVHKNPRRTTCRRRKDADTAVLIRLSRITPHRMNLRIMPCTTHTRSPQPHTWMNKDDANPEAGLAGCLTKPVAKSCALLAFQLPLLASQLSWQPYWHEPGGVAHHWVSTTSRTLGCRPVFPLADEPSSSSALRAE